MKNKIKSFIQTITWKNTKEIDTASKWTTDKLQDIVTSKVSNALEGQVEKVNSINTEVKDILWDKYDELINNKEIIHIEKESFQSQVFQDAAFAYLPEKYWNSDRYFYTVELEDDYTLYIVHGKVSSDNPFEIKHGSDCRWDDFRKTDTTVYTSESWIILEEHIFKDNSVNSYLGYNQSVDSLIEHAQKSLWKKVEK